MKRFVDTQHEEIIRSCQVSLVPRIFSLWRICTRLDEDAAQTAGGEFQKTQQGWLRTPKVGGGGGGGLKIAHQ